jgi:hypothetical protein
VGIKFEALKFTNTANEKIQLKSLVLEANSSRYTVIKNPEIVLQTSKKKGP